MKHAQPHPPESGRSTADLYDRFMNDPDKTIQVATPGLISYGGRKRFGGPISTIRCRPGDALRLKDRLAGPGNGRVLVVDAHAVQVWALLGDLLASLGVSNGWAGVVINGCVRDTAALAAIPFGVLALGAVPSRPVQFAQDGTEVDVPVVFRDAVFRPGHWLYADEDGMLISAQQLVP